MLFKVAQYCNCKPWELAEQPLWWRQKAFDYMNGEAEGYKILDAHTRGTS